MALRLVAGSRGKWEFFLEAWKKSQDINDITGLHKMAAERLEVYLVDKAAAELEGDANPADHASPMSTELISRQRRTEATGLKMTPGRFAAAGLRMAYWDFTEYWWALENLADNLTPAFTRSCCFFAACMAVKGLQLYFWPSFEYTSELTVLTGYHAGFALVYLSSLGLVSHCCRRVENFRVKLREKRVMDEKDV